MRFDGKVAVVTGGASGIGRAAAIGLVTDNAHVVIADVSEERMRRVAEEIKPRRIQCVRADVTDPHDVERLFAQVKSEHGRLDILINCVGTVPLVPFAQLTLEQWERGLKINLTSVFLCCKAAKDLLLAQASGRIVNIASQAGQMGSVMSSLDYVAAKAAIIGITKSLAKILGPKVTVNAVSPGGVDTPITQAFPPELAAKAKSMSPMGRFATPQEIAAAILYLASPEAAYTTGQTLNVNGGTYMM